MKRVACALLFVFAGCTLQVTENGQTKTYRYTGEQVADRLFGNAPPTRDLKLESDFANPTVVGELKSRSLYNLQTTKGTGGKGCYGWIDAEPAVMLDNSDGGLGDVRIASREGDVIYVQLPDDRFVCGVRRNDDGSPIWVRMDQWPRGKLGIFVGRDHKQSETEGPLDFVVEIEDLSRARALGWSDAIRNEIVAESPVDPIVVSGQTPPVIGQRYGGSCRDYDYREIPVLRFEVERPMTDLALNLTSYEDVSSQLVGPIPASNRDLPVRCFGRGTHTLGRLEPGRYALRVGSREPRARSPFHIMLVGERTPRDPLMVLRDVPVDLPVELRALQWHMPFLEPNKLTAKRTVVETAFTVAPKALFVFPKFDFDKVSASYRGPGNNSKPSYPRKNEPLLLLRGRTALTSDGSVYQVAKLEYLLPAPSGKLSLPVGVRNVAKVSKKEQTRFDTNLARLKKLFPHAL